MSMDQIMNYALIVLIIVVAISQGVSTALDFYIKKMAASGKKVPEQVVTVKEASDALYSQANKLLDLTGAEKKSWATDQLLKQKPQLTKEVAAGMIQKSYDDAQKEKVTPEKEDETAQPIGFVQPEDEKND
ncbi:hypothetical protein P5719_001365 [Lactobacillus amylovorus]|uniref:hypothetical protein n=1 Tax=Lactobacillus amylovorus TaxID=1604 RepID=UPI00313E8FE3|nr:hypothetical protein [Lactobacillus amylovorus]